MTSFRPNPGAHFLLDGSPYTVHECNFVDGFVSFFDPDGTLHTLSLEEFIDHPGLAVPGQSRAPVDLVALLPEAERERVLRRLAHVSEAMTGFRSGDPRAPLPGEPKPQYDPERTNLMERYAAKHAELDNEFARQLGENMSITTMRRLARHLRDGVAFERGTDGRSNRRSPGRRSVPPAVIKIIHEVVEAKKVGTTVSRRTYLTEVRRLTLAKFNEAWMEENYPSESTLRRYLHDHWTNAQLVGKARTRATATSAPPGGFSKNFPTRPGEIVSIDTNSLDVLLKGTLVQDAIRGSLVLGIDRYSRSICAVRVVEQTETALDVSAVITDLGRPKQMGPGWPEEARWSFVGVPEELLIGDHPSEDTDSPGISGMPIVNAEAIGLDHGTQYKSQKSRENARRLGFDVVPARVRMGVDKFDVERVFGSLRSMLLEKLPGYRGTDPSERAKGVDAEVEWTAQALEDLISKWVVLVWQTHVLHDVKPPWCPEGDWSPNSLYLHGIETSGVMPRMLSQDDYYGLLRSNRYKIQSRGVNVLGLWFDNDDVLGPLRGVPSEHGTKKYLVQHDRRDLRRVYLVDDETGERHVLTWRGAAGEFPCFGERHIKALRRRTKAEGLTLDDDEIAEMLLTKVLPTPDGEGSAKTSDGRKAAKAASKDADDARTSAADAAKYGRSEPTSTAAAKAAATAPVGTAAALEAIRRTRREAATRDTRVTAAPRLGDRKSSLLPDYDDDTNDDTEESA